MRQARATSLDALLRRFPREDADDDSAGDEGDDAPIDVLKIDCEGCEWTAFTEVARRSPNLLSRVRTVLIEIHAIKPYGMHHAYLVHQLLDFLIHHHGFRVYRSGFNKGWPGARYQVKPTLIQAGFPRMPCCWLFHLVRPPSNTTWLRSAARAMEPAPPFVAPV